MKYKKLAAVGDSYSTVDYGLSWPDLVAEKLQCKLIRAASAGAGNSFYVEKLHDCVKDPDVDLVIVQLTEPSRAVIGLRAWEEVAQGTRASPYGKAVDPADRNHNHIYKDIGCYTMNVHDNQRWLDPFVGPTGVDRFWLGQGAGTRWWNYQSVHSVLAMKQLCDTHNKKVVFFSWFVSWDEFFVPGYEWLRATLLLGPDSVRQQGITMNLPETSDGHYGTESTQRLFDEYLWLNLQPML
jgi:hypothetical protein